MKHSIIKSKSYNFSIRIVKLYKYLLENKEYILSRQLLRSWTSICANIEEWLWWQSKRDFLAKISIAYKEARESAYRLQLLYDTWYIPMTLYESFKIDITTILKIIWSMQKTIKARNL